MAVIQPIFSQNRTATSSSRIQSSRVIQPIFGGNASQSKQQKILPQSRQLAQQPFKVITPKKPIKKDEPGGLFEMIGNIAKNTLTVGSQAKDAIIKHFEEKAPITALLQGNPTEFVARVQNTLKEYERQQKEDPVNFALGFIAPGGGIAKGAKQIVAKETGKKVVKEVGLRGESYLPQGEKLVSQKISQVPQKLSEKKLPQPQVGKLPTQGISPFGIREKLPTADLRQTLPKVYKETPEMSKAIDETARSLKEPPSNTRGVINAVAKIKTGVLEYVQNTEERVRQLVAKKGVRVDDISDPYLKATLYPGRVAEKVTQGKKEVGEIVKGAKKVADEFKTDLASIRKEVNDYLYFRHAPERNVALGEKAAGITTKEAKAGLEALEKSARGTRIRELANRASKLNEQTLDLLKNSGVIPDELYTTLRTRYKNHVPLNRIFEETEDIGSALSSKGFDVRSTGIKRAVGSERAVDDILENIVTNYEQAILRSEKNIVDQATLAFVRNNKDIFGDLFKIIKPKAVGRTFNEQMILERTTDPTILQMFENGQRTWIKINDPHLAVALRGIGREKLGSFLNAVGSFTRIYSGLHTRFNPEFALPNKIRDLQETAVYLASQKGVGFKGAAKTVARDLKQQNTKSILDYIRGKNTEGARLYKELKEMGGTTGGFGLSTKAQVTLNLKNIEKLANSKTRRIADNLVGYIDDWNTIFEDSTRLSVYRQGLEQGLSKERAAFLAKEASINFNRMGKGGPIINSLWMFSNASIQGTTKMIRALRNPKVLGATILTVGGAVATVNEWNDRVDPEWRDKVSKWDRLNGLPIVLPNPDGEGVKYITIPVSWGIKPIKVMTEYAYDAVSGQAFNAKNFIEDTLASMLEAYNPAGGTDLVSALTPTILDTPIELGRNKTWFGGKIRPDYDQNAPEDIKYFQSLRETKTGQVAISISELLQSKMGLAFSPANLKYAFEQYIGGVGRATSKTVNTITGLLGGRPAPIDEYPIVSRFYRERAEEELEQGSSGKTPEIKSLVGEEKREKFQAKQRIQPIYDKVQELKKAGKETEAQKIVDNLSNEDWKVYKTIKTSEKTKQTQALQRKMQPTVLQVQKLLKQGKDSQVQKIVDGMTEDEYKAYKSAKKQLGFE